jgi:hypothetical protein
LRQCEEIQEDLDLAFGSAWQVLACGFDEKTAIKIADVIADDGWNVLSETKDYFIEIVEECCFSPEKWSEYYNSEYTLIKDMVDGKLVDTSNCYWAYTGNYEDGDRKGRHELILCDMDEHILVEIKIVH